MCDYNINNFTSTTQTHFFTRSIVNITNHISFTVALSVYIRTNKFNFNRKPTQIDITIIPNVIVTIYFHKNFLISIFYYIDLIA